MDIEGRGMYNLKGCVVVGIIVEVCICRGIWFGYVWFVGGIYFVLGKFFFFCGFYVVCVSYRS